MSQTVDLELLDEIKKYGIVNIENCFNCGNCTAVCSMTGEDASFPRKDIRYAQLGLKDKLIGSKELWLCYNCGECSETCPRQADPAAFMTAARNYAIASYDPTGLARVLFTRPILAALILIALAILLGLFLYTNTSLMPQDSLRLFEFLPRDFIHSFGLIALIIVVLLVAYALVKTVTFHFRIHHITLKRCLEIRLKDWFKSMWNALAKQGIGQSQFIRDCGKYDPKEPWYISKWFVHSATFWGFLGLLASTALDFLLDIIGVKPTGTFVPLWYPVRFLGTAAGLFLVYGVSVLIMKRILKVDQAHSHSTFSDWAFLILLWLAAVTGFVLEISIYMPLAMWGYWVLLIHVTISMELLLLLPFTKFAHGLIRPLILLVHTLETAPEIALLEQQAA
jgi:ferredoxin